MLIRSIKQLYGRPLSGFDGEIGHVEDFYFNDQEWSVRYVVAATGKWLPERLTLISLQEFGNFYQDGDCPFVNLTREQIKNGPSIDSHKPVSRQHEEAYYRDHGWPYWVGGGMWGVAGFPVVAPTYLIPGKEENGINDSTKADDPHLRSTRDLEGYHIQTGEGTIGHVTDMMVDDRTWAIRHLVVETGHWFSGKEIVISPAQIERISYDESKVFVSVTRKAILEAPEYHVPPPDDAFHDSRNFDE
jgi:sporulation protein YlmC with PRC-barrel domain